eukprot:m.368262 g.368262  ORF g.368262 m.368262 type:complete len:167 (+) comp56096_c1_seq19:790-1290(+)
MRRGHVETAVLTPAQEKPGRVTAAAPPTTASAHPTSPGQKPSLPPKPADLRPSGAQAVKPASSATLPAPILFWHLPHQPQVQVSRASPQKRHPASEAATEPPQSRHPVLWPIAVPPTSSKPRSFDLAFWVIAMMCLLCCKNLETETKEAVFFSSELVAREKKCLPR